LILASEDTAALDEFETLLRTLSDASLSSGMEYTVFYLKYAQASVAAELITTLITGAPPDEGGGAGGGLMGAMMGAALGDAGGGLVSSLLSGGGSSTTTFSSTGLNIVAEPRLNALVVQASPMQLDMIEQLLKVIDQESSPESVQTLPPPRLIPVFNTSAETIANTVRQIYAQQISSGSGQQRQPSPEDFIRALRGGGGSDRGRRAEQAVQQMTVSVDTRSNSLVVSAPDPLFESVKVLVESLDQPGMESPQSTQIVSIQGANAATMKQALTSVLGDVIKTNTTSSGSTSTGGGSSGSTSSQGDQPRQPSSDDFREMMRQRMDFFNNMQRGGDSGRSSFGGGSPFSGRSFGGFGGDRGDRDRGGDRGRGR
jgi:type II secretory pathway component GspD/PulD (secretin)